MMEDRIFLDEVSDIQANNLAWFKQVVGPGWHRVSKIMDLCDALLAALAESGVVLPEEKVWALSTMIHNAKRAGSAGILNFARGQWMEAQPLFRRYVECFGFARIAWADKEDAITWFKGVQDDSAYTVYRRRFVKLLEGALKGLDPSIRESYETFSRGTHSSFYSMRHTLVLGGDEKTLEVGVHYFDVKDDKDTAGYAELFLETVRALFMCLETFAVRTFGAPEWKPSWDHWTATRTPVAKEWLELEVALRRRVGLPKRN